MILKNIHKMRASHKKLSVLSIGPPTCRPQDDHMPPDPTVLIGGTGTTGSRPATKLAHHEGPSVRTAARNNADVHFDWTDPATSASALDAPIAST
jgi:hypothetical protein